MKNILYIDCSISGISGDMTLGSFVDLGVNLLDIEKELNDFPIEPFKLKVRGVNKKGIYSQKVEVVIDNNHPPTHHRHYSEIKKMIKESRLADNVKDLAFKIFEPIAFAEAKIHNSSIDKVHFHEVGAVDSIVDIVGTAIAIDQLEVERIISSPVVVGGGTINIDHGRYPVPAPATLELLNGIPIKESYVQSELTTPTGAAILKGLANSFGPLPNMIIKKVGYGAGSKDFKDHPNVLRTILGESSIL